MAEGRTFSICGISAAGYRSIRSIRFPVDRLSVFVGANGVGKTNLYRALQLIQAAATGTLSHELASEGGMESALWAGERRKNDLARIALRADFGDGGDLANYDYAIAVGLPPSYEVEIGVRHVTAAAFVFEPQVKEEVLTLHHRKRATKVLERKGPSITARDIDGSRVTLASELMASETALSSVTDTTRFPDIDTIRRIILDWRFHHGLRTDNASPLRHPCLAVTSPTLASDDTNLAAVFATLVHIRQDTADLDRAIDDAFPGAKLVVPIPGRTASFGLTLPDYPKRVFQAHELSDGTLRYLALAGVLLAYRLPTFIALNEPETSLHPDMLDPLARLIVRATERAQIWLVTHSRRLAEAIRGESGIAPRMVVKRDGATWIDGLTLSGAFRDDDSSEDAAPGV